MSIGMADLYSVNAASHNQGPVNASAPDARTITATPPATASQPAFSWLALVGVLVLIRVLQEMAD